MTSCSDKRCSKSYDGICFYLCFIHSLQISLQKTIIFNFVIKTAEYFAHGFHANKTVCCSCFGFFLILPRAKAKSILYPIWYIICRKTGTWFDRWTMKLWPHLKDSMWMLFAHCGRTQAYRSVMTVVESTSLQTLPNSELTLVSRQRIADLFCNFI